MEQNCNKPIWSKLFFWAKVNNANCSRGIKCSGKLSVPQPLDSYSYYENMSFVGFIWSFLYLLKVANLNFIRFAKTLVGVPRGQRSLLLTQFECMEQRNYKIINQRSINVGEPLLVGTSNTRKQKLINWVNKILCEGKKFLCIHIYFKTNSFSRLKWNCSKIVTILFRLVFSAW